MDAIDSALVTADLDTLITRLGGELLDTDASLSPEDARRAFRYGQDWLRRRWTDLRTRICANRKLVAGLTGDKPTDIAAVADALSGMMNGPTVLTIAAIIVKYGVGRLCSGEEVPSA